MLQDLDLLFRASLIVFQDSFIFLLHSEIFVERYCFLSLILTELTIFLLLHGTGHLVSQWVPLTSWKEYLPTWIKKGTQIVISLGDQVISSWIAVPNTWQISMSCSVLNSLLRSRQESLLKQQLSLTILPHNMCQKHCQDRGP